MLLLATLAGTGLEGPAEGEAEVARRLAAGAFCACGCGNHLPGSPQLPACFGCSVGKAELAFIREGLAAGRSPQEILLDLSNPVLVDVFADYPDEGLRATWERARRLAQELGYHRLVLRTRARGADARRGVALAECARLVGRFGPVQEALIRHSGPWDEGALLNLAQAQGLDRDTTRACVGRVDVEAQIEKDRNHAKEHGIGSLPAVFVNRERVDDSEEALRRAIQSVLRRGSV